MKDEIPYLRLYRLARRFWQKKAKIFQKMPNNDIMMKLMFIMPQIDGANQ